MSRDYLTCKEAGEYLRLSSRTLEHFRLRGGGPKYYKVGNSRRSPVRYTKEDLDAWLRPLLHTAMNDTALNAVSPSQLNCKDTDTVMRALIQRRERSW